MFLHLSVSHSVHRVWGVCLSACWDITPWADTLLGRHPPWADTPWADPPRQTTPRPSACWDTQCPVHAGIDMATAVGGTHPTGMHSCFAIFFAENCMKMREFGPSGEARPWRPLPLDPPLNDMVSNIVGRT